MSCATTCFPSSPCSPPCWSHRPPKAKPYDLSIGVATLQIAGDNAEHLEGSSGFSLQGNYMWGDFRLENFRLGVGVHLALWADERFEGPASNLNYITQDLFLFLPELRIAYHVPLTDHWFIEPNVGIGLAIAYYSADVSYPTPTGLNDDSATKLGLSLRPGIQAAYRDRDFAIGMEADYLWTRMDFGNDVGGTIGEMYIGVFARGWF